MAASRHLNARFLEACARIVRRADSRVHLRFVIGPVAPGGGGAGTRHGDDAIDGIDSLQAAGIVQAVRLALGDAASVHLRKGDAGDRQAIAGADLFLDPFPCGDGEGLLEAVACGLVGVCGTGPEPFARRSAALFQRLGLPRWTVATDVDGYVAAAVRLVDDHGLRAALRRLLAGPQALGVLARGRPRLFGEGIWQALRLQARSQAQARVRERIPRVAVDGAGRRGTVDMRAMPAVQATRTAQSTQSTRPSDATRTSQATRPTTTRQPSLRP